MLVVVRQRLIEEVVGCDGGFVSVSEGEELPQPDGQASACAVGEQFWFPVRGVVDVGAGLAAGGAVQVEHGPQPVGSAPFDEPVNVGEALVDGPAVAGHDYAPVDGEPDVVEALGTDLGQILLVDEGPAEPLPELGRPLAAHEAPQKGFDLPWGLWAGIGKPPHVALREQPVPQPHAAEL